MKSCLCIPEYQFFLFIFMATINVALIAIGITQVMGVYGKECLIQYRICDAYYFTGGHAHLCNQICFVYVIVVYATQLCPNCSPGCAKESPEESDRKTLFSSGKMTSKYSIAMKSSDWEYSDSDWINHIILRLKSCIKHSTVLHLTLLIQQSWTLIPLNAFFPPLSQYCTTNFFLHIRKHSPLIMVKKFGLPKKESFMRLER